MRVLDRMGGMLWMSWVVFVGKKCTFAWEVCGSVGMTSDRWTRADHLEERKEETVMRLKDTCSEKSRTSLL